jgi:hypothetical protein
MHHPAGHRTGVMDFHFVSEAAQVVCSGETARPRSDHQDALAG